jgi:limonene-1,2-epoxide hydrolase
MGSHTGSSRPEVAVREFCEAVARKDPAELRGFFTDDAIYHNVGLPVSVGLDAVMENLQGQWAMFGRYEFHIRHLVADGDVVLTERVDTLTAGETVADVPVMGAFELRDGKIAAWRDYFDQALVGKLLLGGDVVGLVPA